MNIEGKGGNYNRYSETRITRVEMIFVKLRYYKKSIERITAITDFTFDCEKIFVVYKIMKIRMMRSSFTLIVVCRNLNADK